VNPPADARPATGLPAAFVGHWEGEGQSLADSYLQFRIAIDLRPGRIGSLVGSAHFEGNFHTAGFDTPGQFNLRLRGVSGNAVAVSEQGGFGDVILQLDSGTVTYHARNPGEGAYWVEASLSKVG
jgi:hypothetical protein